MANCRSFLLVVVVLWAAFPTVDSDFFAAPLARALILSIEVGLILLGAIAFLEYMNRSGTTERIRSALASFTDGDPVKDALLLAWFFCGFLEGVSGFGAPAALVAPLLVSIGFTPQLAAVLALIGNSAAVPFGAVGTPVRIGMSGLAASDAAYLGALINVIAGLVAPIAISYLVRRSAREVNNPNKSWIPLALTAGLFFTVPAFAFVFVGPEFPSIGGSLTGLLLFCTYLLRQKRYSRAHTLTALRQLVLSFAPYLLACFLLVLGKLVFAPLTLSVDIFGKVIASFSFFSACARNDQDLKLLLPPTTSIKSMSCVEFNSDYPTNKGVNLGVGRTKEVIDLDPACGH